MAATYRPPGVATRPRWDESRVPAHLHVPFQSREREARRLRLDRVALVRRHVAPGADADHIVRTPPGAAHLSREQHGARPYAGRPQLRPAARLGNQELTIGSPEQVV